MEERLNRRSRPRPYDLRRKVLMKNFFREQMSYVPASREISDSLSDSNRNASFTEESSSSVDDIGNAQSAEDENDSSNVLKENVVPSSNKDLGLSVVNNDGSCESNQDLKTEIGSRSILSNFTRLSNFMKLRSMSEAKKTNKGIVKAKHVRKNKRSGKVSCHTNRLDTFFNRRDFKKDNTSENCASDTRTKSIFSIFRSRRKKGGKASDTLINNSACGSTSNQFVQTDISWDANEINNVEETNRLLLEENKLLSQSLSLLMSSTSQSTQLSPSLNIHTVTSHEKEIVEIFPTYHHEMPCELFEGSVTPNTVVRESQSRILRSKSVYEQSEKKVRKCHRAKSMSYHRSVDQRISSSDSRFDLQIRTPPDVDYRKLRFPRGRSPVLQTLPVNNPRQTIRRRPSLPERTNSENIRPFRRRSESMHSYDHKRPSIPFHALPAQAFY